MLSKAETTALRDLTRELEVLRLGAPSAVGAALEELRVLSGIEQLVCWAPLERLQGWELERLDAAGVDEARVRRVLGDFLLGAPRRFACFDVGQPESEQRNVLVDVTAVTPGSELRDASVYAGVLVPLGWHQQRIARVLLCDGPALVGWFGALQTAPLAARQRDLLVALVPALRKRLVLERQLAAAPLQTAALEVVLDRIGAAAFIVSARGRVIGVNPAGRELLEQRRAEVSEAIKARIAGKPSALAFELTQLRISGPDTEWLAVLDARTPAARISRSALVAATRLGLSARQREVLELTMTGASNQEIAAALGISARAVEQHLSTLFDRAAVTSRASLVAFVLAAL